MWSGNQYIVRRSPWMLGFQIVAAFVFIGMGVWLLGWKTEPVPTEGQKLLAWFVIAGGLAGLLVLGLRARQPAQVLAIDASGLTWWKADRTIAWAEIEAVTIDAWRSTLYLHVTLGAESPGVATDPAHPIEAFGSMLTRSDLSFRLSGSTGRRDELRQALEEMAPAHVRILPELG